MFFTNIETFFTFLLVQVGNLVALIQGQLFETLVQPAMFQLGLSEYVEAAFEGTEWFVIGLLEISFLALVLQPLEKVWPVERNQDRQSIRIDMLYTCLHRLGAFTLIFFFSIDPLLDHLTAFLHLEGFKPFNLEDLWPAVTGHAWISFFIYLVVLDFVDYWYHRAEHQFDWWWNLHSLHHSQRSMTLWSDDRNHLLDDLLRDVTFALVANLIGVPPSQFIWLVVLTRLLQSLQHANLRCSFGWLGERLLVSPRFHRTHHAIGFGHEVHHDKTGSTVRGCNFGVLLPIWDMLFGTADFRKNFEATGIRDQLPPPLGKARNYGRGFWQQQWFGIKRLLNQA